MGLFDKMAGRPQAPRKAASKREERHNERASMRASRDSSNWGMTSPSNSTTGQGGFGHAPSFQQHGYSSQGYNQSYSQGYSQGYGGQGYGGQGYGHAPSRRVSTQGSRRGSSPQQPSPVPSPRGHEGPSMVEKMKLFVGMGPMPGSQAGSGNLGAGSGNLGHGQSAGRNPDNQYHQSQSAPRPPVMDEQQGRSGSQSAQAAQLQDQVRELTHKLHNMEAERHEVEGLKQKLLAEQRSAQDWRDKWNYQNFKLNLMVDMLVLHSLETEAVGSLSKPGGHVQTQPGSLVSGLNKPSITVPIAQQQPQQIPAGGMAGVGRTATSRRVEDLVEEEYDG